LELGKVLAVGDNIITVKTGDGSVDFIEHEFKIIPRVGEYLL
jgi:methionyl-tRNA formyltransferase